MILIAGMEVKIGDKLYHRDFRTFGRVSRFDASGSAEVIIPVQGGERKFLVQQGGMVNGRRQMYWHEPIELDLPRTDVSSVQTVVNILAQELAR